MWAGSLWERIEADKGGGGEGGKTRIHYRNA